MKRACPECGSSVPLDSADSDNMVACPKCHALMRAGVVAGSRRPVHVPAGTEVHEAGEDLVLVQRWFDASSALLLVIAISVDLLTLALFMSWLPARSVPVLGVLVVQAVFAVLLTYGGLAGLLNRTRISARPGRLEVDHGPLPWPGGTSLDTRELEQLYARRVTHRNRHGLHYSYEVRAILARGGHTKVIGGFDESVVRFVEYSIEEHLGIADRAVTGELTKH